MPLISFSIIFSLIFSQILSSDPLSCSPGGSVAGCTVYSSNSACSACLDGYYLGDAAGCFPNNCGACSSPGYCSSCNSGYIYNGACYSSCPTTTFQSGSSCVACPNYCDVCSSGSVCTTCSSGFKLYQSQCYLNCPAATFPSGATCQDCPSHCDTCTDSNTCTACSSTWRLYQSLCYNPCPVTTFANGNSICSDCPSHCDVCIDGNTCTTCSSGYKLYQTQCYNPCPVTTYTLGTNCLDCGNYCDVCVDSNTCTVCTAGYYFYQQKCYVKCPSKAPFLSPTVIPYFCFETCPAATPYSYQNLCYTTCPAEAPYLMDNVCYTTTPAAELSKFSNYAGSAAGTALIARNVASVSNPSLFMFGSLMKLLEYTRYMNISHSDSLKILFQTISDSSDLIPMPSMSSEMQNALVNHPLPDVFARYSLPSNFMLNEGDDILSLLTILSLFVIFWIMQKGVFYLRNVDTIRSLVKKSRFFFQNYLIGKFYEMLGDVFFAAFFEFKTLSMTDRYSWLSLLACVSCLVLGAFLYGINFWIIYAYQKKKKNLTIEGKFKKKELEKFSEKYNGIEVLFGGFGDESFLHQAAFIFFIARNILSSLVIAIFYSMPLFQTAILIILSFFMMVYYITIRPIKSRVEFLEQLGFELLLLAVNACFFIQAMCDMMQTSTKSVVNAIGQTVIMLNTIFKFLPLIFLAIQFGLMIWKYYKLLKLALRSEGTRKKEEMLKQSHNDSSLSLGSSHQSSFQISNVTNNSILDQSMPVTHHGSMARLKLLRNSKPKQKSKLVANKTGNPSGLLMNHLADKHKSPKKPVNLPAILKREPGIRRAVEARKTVKVVKKRGQFRDL